MPFYLDHHHVEGAGNTDIEEAHKKDLEVQDKYETKFLTYWFDSSRGSVFCLVDAPDQESVRKVHDEAHGDVPHKIIEVDLQNIETFMGRIKDPTSGVPIDSAFRCILFTDLKSSTTMSTMIGDSAAIALLEQHDKMIRAALAAHQGREVKHTGDGFMACFTDVAKSIKCAMAIQQAFHEFNKTDPKLPLRVRIGINAGEPVERGGDLFGTTVQLAARVCDHSDPDNILVCGVIRELCSEEVPAETFSDAGRVTFKGFPFAVQLYEVNWQPAGAASRHAPSEDAAKSAKTTII